MTLQKSAVKKNLLSSQISPYTTIKLVQGISPKIVVNFSLDRSGTVEIRLFDPFGRTVAMFANKTYAAGKHFMIMETSGLSPGCYMARINANGKSTIKTVLLER